MTACLMCISSVLDGTIVALSAQFPSPTGIALASRDVSTYMVSHNLRPHESAAGRCRCRPPALAQAGMIFCQRGLMTMEEFCAQCCRLVVIHRLFSHAHKRKYFVSAHSKILFCHWRENMLRKLRSWNHVSDAGVRSTPGHVRSNFRVGIFEQNVCFSEPV